MKETILITGGSGNLAQALSKTLKKKYTLRYLTTKKSLTNKKAYFYWDIKKKHIDTKALENCTHIIHLAGHSILKKWSEKNKKKIYESRINSTNLLFDKCNILNVKIQTFICASAIGIYDRTSNKNLNETATKGNDWIARMVCDWEDSSNKFKSIGARVIQMRISLILDKNAGFLKYNLLSMKYGIGLILGDKTRKINWIHIDDIRNFIIESINNTNYNGPYNLASNEITSQSKFIKSIKNKLFPYAITIKIPIYLIRLFIGESTQIIETDINISVGKLKNEGFLWDFNTLQEVLTEIHD